MSLAQFTERAEAAGSTVAAVAGWAEVADLATRLAQHGDIVVAPSLASSAPDLMAALGSRGRLPDPDAPVASVADAAVGVVAGDMAVAETGSVLVCEDELADRAVSMLSLALIQVVAGDRVLPALEDAADRLAERGPGYAVLSTSSSRTADIERSLTIGVQGPASVHVVVMG